MSTPFARVKFLLVVVLTLSVLLSACGAQATPAPDATVPPRVLGQLPDSATKAPIAAGASAPSFSKDVFPILQSRCISCHGGEQTSAGLSMTSYDTLMAGSQNGAVVVPGNSDNSLLIRMILAGKMPKRGPKLLPDQVQLLIDWVNAGALNN